MVAPFAVTRSVQRLDGCDRDQVLYGLGAVAAEGDPRVGVQLRKGDSLGVEGARPAGQAGGLPRDLR
jgi:hypothetical protein